MSTSPFTFQTCIPGRHQADAWARQVKLAYPDHDTSTDTAAAQIVGSMTMTLGGFDLFLCLAGGSLVGLLAYRVEDCPARLELFNFAVLPSHQWMGIGTALLAMAQGRARGEMPIFACGVNASSIRRLLEAGFWRVRDRPDGNATYKWSDLPRHQNDDTPWADEVEDGAP